jgi:hypothetical protein
MAVSSIPISGCMPSPLIIRTKAIQKNTDETEPRTTSQRPKPRHKKTERKFQVGKSEGFVDEF